MEGFFAALNIETDRIHYAKRASNRAGDGALLANICCKGLKQRITAAGLARPPGGDADSKPLVMQMTDDPAPQKAGPAKHGHYLRHGTGRRL